MSSGPIESLETVAERRGASVLLETLSSVGCEYVFGNPGTTELPLMDALLDAPQLKYVWALQEASVVAMADGYAQAAGRPGFINLHTAGGLGHGMGNLLNASVSCTPLVVTAGQQDRRHSLTDPLLLGDLVSIARPAVKWAQEVSSADQLPVLVRRAFQDANAAPSGPVFLSLPMDVMEEMSTLPVDEPSTIDRRSVAGSLEALADHLAGIRPSRLAIIAGDEIHSMMQGTRHLSSRKPWALRCSDRHGQLAFHLRLPARYGPATCQRRRRKSLKSFRSSTPSSRWVGNR